MHAHETEMNLGAIAPETPIQENIDSVHCFCYKGYRIIPLAGFEIKAKVLSKHDYRVGRESSLSSTDLALGWGRMSDDEVLSHLEISQSHRWYHWHTEDFPIPRWEIETHSANMHMIPKNTVIATKLKKVHKGDLVSLKGKLVNVNALDGWHWMSSLSRDDTGEGACEVIFVEAIEVEKLKQRQ